MKRKNLTTCLAFVLTMILTSCAKDIADLTGNITGKVADIETNVAIEGCIVSITPTSNSTSTSNAGVYSFNDLDAGSYTLSFSKSGYESATQMVTAVAGETKTCNVFLESLNDGIEVTPKSLNFGDLESVMELFIKRKSSLKNSISYNVKADVDYITISPSSGTLNSEQQTLKVTIDRTNLSVGDYSKKVTISTQNGSVEIPVLFKQVEHSAPNVTNKGDFYDITEISFKVDGTLLSLGGNKVINYGHCWSKKELPTIVDNCTKLGETNDVCDFTSTITEGIVAGETYYVRAYATNVNGTSYSEQMMITIPRLEVPSVKTYAADNISKTNATLNGEILSNGGTAITDCGFYYGANSNPTQKQAMSTTTSSKLKFTLTSLTEGTKYYFRVYARNSKGETKGEVMNFTTFSDKVPTVTTKEATDITSNSAVLNGLVADNGSSNITECGFYYGTISNPTNKVKQSTGNTNFNYSLNGLKPGTKYYFKAYAINAKGESEGNVLEFTTKADQANFDIDDYSNEENYK